MQLNQNFQIVEVEGKKVYIQNKTDLTKQLLCDQSNSIVERIAVLLYPDKSLSMEEIVLQLGGKAEISKANEAVAKLKSIGVIE